MPEGSWLRAALMAACTSRAASSTLRFRSNSSVTLVAPWLLLDWMRATPAMLPSARSSGPATVAAMLSGLAPGRLARTWITGKSTRGSGATGNRRSASRPASSTAMASMALATGRWMKKRARVFTRLASLASAVRGAGPGGRRPGTPPAS